MAFVTSYEKKTPGGIRIRVLCCYHDANEVSDDPKLNHTVHYAPDGPGGSGRLPHVGELWTRYGWGRRGKQLPVCPSHRKPDDADWPEESEYTQPK